MHRGEHVPMDRDGVASLHDVEAKQGDEEGLDDTLDIDEREARELGVALDPVALEEPTLRLRRRHAACARQGSVIVSVTSLQATPDARSSMDDEEVLAAVSKLVSEEHE